MKYQKKIKIFRFTINLIICILALPDYKLDVMTPVQYITYIYIYPQLQDQESPSEILLSIQVHADLVTDGPNQNIRKYVQDQLLPMLQKQEEDSKVSLKVNVGKHCRALWVRFYHHKCKVRCHDWFCTNCNHRFSILCVSCFAPRYKCESGFFCSVELSTLWSQN